MKLLFNATMIRSEGGVSLLFQYLENFISARPDLVILLYLNPDLAERITASFSDNPRISIVVFKPKNFLSRFWWEQVTLPGIIRKEKVDCLLSYGNTGPLLPGCRQILYVQQAIPYTRFKPDSGLLKWLGIVWLFRMVIGIAQFGSEKIVVQTHWLVKPLRRSILNLLPENRYTVSLPGLPDSGEQIEPTASEKDLILSLHSLQTQGTRLLFYPAFLAPYKHFPYLLNTVAHLKKTTQVPFRMILTFDENSLEYLPCKTEIFQLLTNLNLGDQVILTGSLSRATIGKIYDLTDLLLFPSRVESLGMPLLEALQKNIPIIACKQAENFAEDVCGNAALYADPESPEDFSHKIRQLLEDAELYESLQRNARTRAMTISWETHINEILS